MPNGYALIIDNPDMDLDGAVCELTTMAGDPGVVYAQIRIPAPSPLIAPAGDTDHG